VPVTQAPESTRWEDVFAKPTAMQVVAYNTGFVLTGPSVLIDENNPRTPASEKVEQWVPSLSYLASINCPYQAFAFMQRRRASSASVPSPFAPTPSFNDGGRLHPRHHAFRSRRDASALTCL
jgi:hypothetical protein